MPPIDDETLRQYLAESLPSDGMARVEKALRDSADLREHLETVRTSSGDTDLHSLGAIWRRSRLSCATRRELGSYLLDALDPEHAEYLRFHVQVVECPFCAANLADLSHKAEQVPAVAQIRQTRIYHSSRHLLAGD